MDGRSRVVNTALSIAFATWAVTLLVRDELLNPEFVQFVFADNGVDADTLRILAVINRSRHHRRPDLDHHRRLDEGLARSPRARGIGWMP